MQDSAQKPLRAIGLTAGLGIALSFLFAPATLLLLHADEAAPVRAPASIQRS